MWEEAIEGSQEEMTHAQNGSPGLRSLDVILGTPGHHRGSQNRGRPGTGVHLGMGVGESKVSREMVWPPVRVQAAFPRPPLRAYEGGGWRGHREASVRTLPTLVSPSENDAGERKLHHWRRPACTVPGCAVAPALVTGFEQWLRTQHRRETLCHGGEVPSSWCLGWVLGMEPPWAGWVVQLPIRHPSTPPRCTSYTRRGHPATQLRTPRTRMQCWHS